MENIYCYTTQNKQSRGHTFWNCTTKGVLLLKSHLPQNLQSYRLLTFNLQHLRVHNDFSLADKIQMIFCHTMVHLWYFSITRLSSLLVQST